MEAARQFLMEARRQLRAQFQEQSRLLQAAQWQATVRRRKRQRIRGQQQRLDLQAPNTFSPPEELP